MDHKEYQAFVQKYRHEPIKPLTVQDFGELEKSMGEKMPADFMSYYLKHNGVSNSHVYSFMPVKYGLSIERYACVQKQQGIDFGKKIWFADDIDGHKYLLSLEAETYGQVLFLQHEFEREQDYIFVADSFTDFMNEFVMQDKTALN